MNKNKILLSIALVTTLSCAATASANTMLGAYIKHDGWSLTEIDKFNTDTAKPMAVTTLFTNFDMHWDSLRIQASNIVSRDAIPVISLMPWSNRHPDMLAAIASGAEDAYIASWIQSFKAWRESYPEGERPVIMLRFGHEFNGNWYPWGNDPQGFQVAWRHMHAMFAAAGVNDAVEWVWCANATDVDDYNDITLYYPGDDVVDWTSLDGYNWGSNYAWTSWRSFDEVFSSAYVTLVNNFPDKPILLAEVGSAEPGDLPDPDWGQYGDNADAAESKPAWVSEMMRSIKADYPAIRALSWFNVNKELSWALNDTAHSGAVNTGLDAYNQAVMDDHFSSEYTVSTEGEMLVLSQASGQEGVDEAQTEESSVDVQERVKADRASQKAERRTGRGAAKAERQQMRADVQAERQAKRAELRAERAARQRKLAESRKPAVVGDKSRKREANGFRNLSTDVLKKIRNRRLGLN